MKSIYHEEEKMFEQVKHVLIPEEKKQEDYEA